MTDSNEQRKDILQPRLTQLCGEYDRTAAMGLFPHDPSGTPIDVMARGKDPIALADDRALDAAARDQAIWSLVYRETSGARRRDLPDLLYSMATSEKEDVLRRSSSWALFKLGEVKLLTQSLRSDDSGNVTSWKQHLIYESQGRTDWVDPRPFRTVESPLGYTVTLPLTIHGLVVFRTPKADFRARAKKSRAEYGSASNPYAMPGARAKAAPAAAAAAANSTYSYDASTTRGSALASAATPPPHEFDWHELPVGPISQRLLVGDLTAAVQPGSFYDNLTIQKVCTDLNMQGLDHVQGYLFRGMSRSLGGNVMAHYYSSRGPQPLYLSGMIGDASEGVVDVETELIRHAETHIATNSSLSYPYVQSVRGLFYGPARMNTLIADDPDAPLDNLLQIVRDPYANGWFFGEFRSVPVDVDGDGQVEINGMEMYTDAAGRIVNRSPAGPQPSLAFAR